MDADREHVPSSPGPGAVAPEPDDTDHGGAAPSDAPDAPDPGALDDLPYAPAPAGPVRPIVLGGSDGTDPFDPDGEDRP